MWGLSLVVASGFHSSSRCTGLSLSRPLLLRSTGSRRAGSVVVAHGPSCSAACGIFPPQGLNPCPLHWQADSQPLRHQGSPPFSLFLTNFCYPVGQDDEDLIIVRHTEPSDKKETLQRYLRCQTWKRVKHFHSKILILQRRKQMLSGVTVPLGHLLS